MRRVEICPFPLLWPLAYTTACAIKQAVLLAEYLFYVHNLSYSFFGFIFSLFFRFWAVC